MPSGASRIGTRSLLSSRNGLALLVGAAVFLLALDGGAYAVGTRTALAIAVWWTLLLLAVLGVGLPRPWSRPVLVAGGVLAAFAAWALVSATWAPSAEDAVAEGSRALLYLGVFLLAAVARDFLRPMTAGLAAGLVAVAVVALTSRLYPDVVDPGPLAETVAAAQARLSYPVGYWNGLAMLVALGLPLLLGLAVRSDGFAGRFVALLPVPALLVVPYLASSRGGFGVAVAGVLLFLALTARRWTALLAVLVGAAGAAAAIAFLAGRPAIVDAPLEATSDDAAAAAAAIVVSCVAAALVFALLRAVPVRRSPPAVVGWGVLGLAVAATLAVAISLDPVRQFEDFRRAEPGSPATVGGHLLNASSTGRWQQWAAAVDQFESEPLHGGGAGSYGGWWLQHRTNDGFVTEAHSLFLEVLGELGLVGFALLAAAVLAVLWTGVSRALRAPPLQRILIAATTASGTGYLAGAAIDWMWELTIVSVVGFACLGLAAGGAGERPYQPAASVLRAGRVVLAIVAVATIALQADAFLVDAKLRDSERAAAREELNEAAAAARTAADLAPWAASPRLQLALLSEQAGDLGLAQRHLDEAIDRDTANWRLWLVATRLHVKQGEAGAGGAALRRARELNPRSPLLRPRA